MEVMADREQDALGTARGKTLKPLHINDFLLTYMLLSPKPIVAVSTAITGAKSPRNESVKAVDCYVLDIPWQRDC
jgi:hypothetical protein